MASVIGQFFKNVATTWINMVVTLVIGFFFTPYLISMLGKDRYGIWNLAFAVIAYLGLADLGLKQSIVRFISKYYATKDWKQLNEVFSSAAKLYFLVAVIVAAITLSVVFGFIRFFKIPDDYVWIAQITMLVLGLNEAIFYMTMPFTALGAFHRFDITAYFKIARLILQTVGIIVLLELGYGLIAMALVVFFITSAFILGLNGIRRKLFPENYFSMDFITRDKTKMLFDYGIYSFLIAGAWIVIFQSDNIIIGGFISMEAVAIYSVAGMISTQIRGAMQIIAVPLVPAISHFEAEKDIAKIIRIYNKSTRYMYYVSGFVCIAILVYGGPFILMWVGEDFKATIRVLHILMIAAAIHLPQTVANSVLFGVSKHRIAFYVLLSEAVSKITLSIILLHFYGIVGVALGTAIPQLIIYIFVYPYVFHRAIGADVRHFYLTAFRSLLLCAIFILPSAYVLSIFIRPDSWGKLIINCIIIGVIMMVVMAIFIFDSEDRHRVFGKLRKIL